jgi:hypothetical protein
MPRGQRDGSQLYSRGWADPVPDPLLLRKIWYRRESNPDLWICSQELWLQRRSILLHYTVQPRYIELRLSNRSDSWSSNNKLDFSVEWFDRLCGLVVRVLGYRSGGPGSIPGTTKKRKVVGLERGPLSLVSTTEELLDRKVAAPV